VRARAIGLGVAGAGLAAWLAGPGWDRALALVALAGVGALFAVGGRLRRGLGGLLLAVGVALVASGGYAVVADGAARPLAVFAGGVAVAVAGWLVARFGAAWPALGSRFDRPASGPTSTPRDTWDALDRGEDPTRGNP
jgi:hypothetical protein